MVTVTVFDCPCGPAWGPDCCMSNAVGMMLGAVTGQDHAIPRRVPRNQRRARAAETRTTSARDVRGANARSRSTERMWTPRGRLRVGVSRSRSRARARGALPETGAGLEKKSGRASLAPRGDSKFPMTSCRLPARSRAARSRQLALFLFFFFLVFVFFF